MLLEELLLLQLSEFGPVFWEFAYRFARPSYACRQKFVGQAKRVKDQCGASLLFKGSLSSF